MTTSSPSVPPASSGVTLARQPLLGVVSHRRWLLDALLALLKAAPAFSVVDLGEGAVGSLERLRRVRPRAVLVDLPPLRAIRFVREAQRIAPTARLVLLGHEDADSAAVSLFEAGLTGFVPPSESLDDVQGAIQNALRGELSCPSHIVAALVQRFRQHANERRWRASIEGLTAREQQVLGLVEDGYANKEIAMLLGVEVSTVKTHVHQVLAKSAVHRRQDVGVKPGRHGTT